LIQRLNKEQDALSNENKKISEETSSEPATDQHKGTITDGIEVVDVKKK